MNGERSNLRRLLGQKKSLTLLPQFLSRVSNDSASANALNSLLRIVHKYPLLEHSYDKSDGLSSLRKQVINAAEKYLVAYSQVSVRFYTMRISLIQIPHCRYAAQRRVNMKKQKQSSHWHRPMSMNLLKVRPSSSGVAVNNKLISMS
jgi:hypothetical protein